MFGKWPELQCLRSLQMQMKTSFMVLEICLFDFFHRFWSSFGNFFKGACMNPRQSPCLEKSFWTYFYNLSFEICTCILYGTVATFFFVSHGDT